MLAHKSIILKVSLKKTRSYSSKSNMLFTRVHMDLNAYLSTTTHCELFDCDEILHLTSENTLFVYRCAS